MRLFLLFLCGIAGHAQEFEVASIKASGQFTTNYFVAATGGPGSNDPTHYTWPGATIQGIMLRGYGIKAYQLSGPDWLSSERFDVSVVLPVGTTSEQFAAMWRNLLALRFGVRVRVEKKEFTVEELVIAPGGHKLRETADPNVEKLDLRAGVALDKEGKLQRAGILILSRSGSNGFTAEAMGRAQPMSAIAELLEGQIKSPVFDKTGLTGKYDFNVGYSPPAWRPNGRPEAAAVPSTDVILDLATAIQQQLGLRLKKGKGMLDYVVVEKADRVPTEN